MARDFESRGEGRAGAASRAAVHIAVERLLF